LIDPAVSFPGGSRGKAVRLASNMSTGIATFPGQKMEKAWSVGIQPASAGSSLQKLTAGL